MFTEKSYSGKILLFGEYTVVFGGSALAIPYSKYDGRWIKNKAIDQRLLPYLDYLGKINSDLHAPLNMASLTEHWLDGWTFESSIPPGLGLGSSAALCASIYDTGFDQALHSAVQAKEDLARLEHYFHGKSSGFDALIPLYHAPFLVKGGKPMICKLPLERSYHLRLWNTGISRSTQPLVHQFQNKLKDPVFKADIESLTRLSDTACHAFLAGEDHLKVLKEISRLQYTQLTFLIPPHCRTLWKKTLDVPNLAIKLCGAGGGGYLLIASQDPMIAQSFFDDKDLEIVGI